MHLSTMFLFFSAIMVGLNDGIKCWLPRNVINGCVNGTDSRSCMTAKPLRGGPLIWNKSKQNATEKKGRYISANVSIAYMTDPLSMFYINERWTNLRTVLTTPTISKLSWPDRWGSNPNQPCLNESNSYTSESIVVIAVTVPKPMQSKFRLLTLINI